jgi:hypothetical protein
MEDSVMAKKLTDNFHAYDEILVNGEEPTIPADHFHLYRDLQKVNHKHGETIVYQFLNKVYDSTEQQIKN